jgi:hypothetical protein
MKSKYKQVVFNTILLLVLSRDTTAQFNESDTMKLQLQISLTGNYQKGNVELFTLLSRNEFLIRPFPNWALKSQISSLYTKFSDKQIDNNIFSRNVLYYKPERRLYSYISAFVSTNYRRKIKFRYFITSGPALQAIQSKAIVVKLSVALVYESTLFTDTVFNQSSYNGNERINLWRSHYYVGGWAYALNNQLRVNYEFYWQPAFNNSKNYRIQSEVGLTYPIWKGLAFNTVYIFSHENLVVENIKKDDRILTFGLSYLLRKNSK